jgi:hypothetical protein
VSIYRECQHQESPEGSACGYYAEAGCHRTVEECNEFLGLHGRTCPSPEEHHVFVPRSDVNLDLSEADVRSVINALEAALALPERMRRPYGLGGADEDEAQALHDRLLAYMDLVAAGEAP